MCWKKIRAISKQKIEEEKNIKIRERIECRFTRLAEIIIGLLFAGNLFAGIKSLYSTLIMSIGVIALLILYVLLENYVIFEYEAYTDHLIRRNSKRKGY